MRITLNMYRNYIMKKAHKMSKKTKEKILHDKKVISFIVIILLVLGLLISVFALRQKTQENTSAAVTFVGLHAQGNKIVTQSGQPIQLRGVSISGSEFNCVQGANKIFSNPANQQEITTMKSWNINVVRIPLNEDCWLGINGANPGGSAYQSAVEGYVNLLTSNGIAAILDLHWNAPGTQLASAQQDMADSDHTPAFWTSVSNTFKNNGSVIFELYNEPNSISWSCWLNGGSTCSNPPFPIAGMQTLLNSIRATGATNLVVMGGLAWSNDLSGWLANEPKDPLNNIGATWHVYSFNACTTMSCWTSQVLPVANKVPLIATEVGESDCAGTFDTQVYNWLNSISQNYTGWAWFPGGCGFPSLISDYNGTATAAGQSLKSILTGLPKQPVPVSTGGGGSVPSVSSAPSPTVALLTPTFGVVGDCQTNNTCPTVTPGSSGNNTNPSTAPSSSVSISPMPSVSGIPTNTPNVKNPSGGGSQNLITILLQLITLILKFLQALIKL